MMTTFSSTRVAFRLALSSVALLIVVQLASAAPTADTVPNKSVYNLLVKLESIIGGESKSSGVTMDELKAAHSQYTSWTPETRQHNLINEPRVGLLNDFLFTPMNNPFLMPETEEHIALYIKRLEGAYRKFRPAYMRRTFVGDTYHVSKHTNLLLSSLNQEKDSPPLTLQLLKRARDEYNSFYTRMREYVEFEDIFTHINDYRLLLNYTNRDHVKILAKFIFPLIDGLKNDEDAQQMRDIFRNAFGGASDG